MPFAAAAANALTGVFWLVVAALVAARPGPGPVGLLVALYVVLATLRFVSAFGLIGRKPWAYQRSLRNNIFGALLALALALTVKGLPILFALIVLDLLGALFTFLARRDFQTPPP